MTPEDRRHLSLAFDLAARGLGQTSPNPAVGALVVSSGTIVGRGHHARAGGEHAETVALREAGSNARGADLFVNLEPCCAHRFLEGRVPSCVEQILKAGVARVVAAAQDPNPLINGRGLELLARGGVQVEPVDPYFARKGARFNEVFFKYVTTRTPFVTLKTGMTLDGRIALPTGESRWITGEEARADARALRSRHDAVLIGVGTAIADDPLLAAEPRPAREPARVVLDSRLRLTPASRLAQSSSRAPVLVYTSDEADGARRTALEALGVEVVTAGAVRPDLARVLADLGGREITSVLAEGGGEVLGSFLRAGLGDKVRAYVALRLMGGRESLPAFGGHAPASLGGITELEEVEVRRLGDTLVVEGYPRRPRASAERDPRVRS